MQISDKKSYYINKVHFILAHSYSVYFILFLIGVYLDLVFKFKIFVNPIMVPIGAGILIVATLLILWAQATSLNLKKDTVNKETFCQGPYCYTRSPTHLGLFLLLAGFGIMTNSFFIILSTAVSYCISKLIFVEKEEKILAEKYGAPYLEYKKTVKF